MTIQTVYRVQCQPCGRYLRCLNSPYVSADTITSDAEDAEHFDSFSAAYDEAVRRGWCAYPLICPGCAADLKNRASHEPEDRRPVRKPGESPQRP